MILLVLWGGVAAIRITKESAPEVQIPIGIVTTVLPGGSAEDVERLVTNKLEDRLANLTDLKNLTSVSREGVSIITAEFNASADIDESIQKLKDEVDKAKSELPNEAEDPSVTDVNFVDQPIQIISISADLPFAAFAELGDEVKNELQTVAGVSRVDVSGVRHREISVIVRKEDLARYGIALSSVVQALGAANASLPVGSIVSNDISYNIAFEGSLDEVDDISSVPILSSQGQVIYLRDVADVIDGVEKAASYSRVSLDGAPSEQALTLLVYKVRGVDVTSVTEGILEKIEELKLSTLALSSVVITYDTGEQIATDLEELTRTGIITVALVMAALFATIGWREAIVAGLSIPLSFLIAFIGLWYSGNTFNFISLFSLILSIGILVDSGIVIVEAIHTRLRKFGNKHEAAYASLKEYAWPLIGGTMTTIAVFFPLFFISGIVGEFIASIPFTVIFVLVASIFVALGLVPVLALLFSREDHSDLSVKQEEYTERARTWYASKLHGFFANRKLQNRFLLAMGIGFILALSLPIVGLLKVEFFPQEDIDFVYVDIEMPSGTPLEQTDLVVRAVEETLYGTPDVESLVITVGATSEFSNNPQRESRYGSITVNLRENRKNTSTEVVEDIRERVAAVQTATIRADQPSGGPPVGAPILIKFSGADRDTLNEAIELGRQALAAAPGATSIDTSNKNESMEFTLTVNRARISELGLSPLAIASTLRTAVAGTEATSITDTDRDVDIVVSLNLNPAYRDAADATYTSIESLRQIPITTPAGSTILLGSVLEDGIRRSDTVITHDDRKRTVTLTANVAPGTTVKEVLTAYQENMEAVILPEGVEMTIGGENEETDQSFLEMGFALIAGLALMFVILVLAFNSFRFTSYLLLIVPLSLIGVFGGLALTAQPLSFPSLLGVIALAGVIINHAIILMDSIIQRIKSGAGKAFSDIVIDAAVSRLRPIFLTTITTVIGMVPLIFASPIWGPLAFAILFGLSFAMILTLILIPLLVYRWPGKLPGEIVRK